MASPTSSPPSLLPKHEIAPGFKSSSPPKKSPAFPWSHQETLALIQAYQEKWYSLNKGQLKAFQWEEVANSCGFSEPSKTSTQCRHKIEKLRKRYRSEMQKPYPDSWQYFQIMDQMERGPMTLNARPITVVKSSTNNAHNYKVINNNNSNKLNPPRYANLYSAPDNYHTNGRRGDDSGLDESDEEWSAGVKVAKRRRSKTINNPVHGNMMCVVKKEKRVTMEMDFNNGGSDRVKRVPRNQKQKHYYGRDDSEDDDDDLKEEEDMHVEDEGEDGDGGKALALEIKGFAERFMGIENKKIEMMRERERYRMEMEKKRMEMILEAQRKIIDTIGSAFRTHKKVNMDQET